jgi:hypothetical protein
VTHQSSGKTVAYKTIINLVNSGPSKRSQKSLIRKVIILDWEKCEEQGEQQ